jgi:putative NADPH-quinone reductase
MKAVVVYGSPRGKNSASYRLGSKFTRGLEDGGHQVQEIMLNDYEIGHCKGCKSCWTATPGKCAQNDGMAKIVEDHRNADLVVLSVPLYFFTVPGKVKDYLDRQLPLYLETFHKSASSTPKDSKTWLEKIKFVLISPCGLPEKSNFDGLKVTMKQIFGSSYAQDFLVPFADGMAKDYDETIFSDVYALMRDAGMEFGKTLTISQETRNRFEQMTTMDKEKIGQIIMALKARKQQKQS